MPEESVIKNKSRNIAIMVISQLLLTLFVSYWLVNQYKDQKQILQGNIFQYHHDVKSEMINKKIHKLVFCKIIEHNDTINLENLSFEHIHLPESKKLTLVKDVFKIVNDNEGIISKLNNYFSDENHMNENDENTLRVFEEILNAMYRNGIRANHLSSLNRRFTNAIPFDSIYYKQLLGDYFNMKELNFNIHWVSEHEENTHNEDMICLVTYNYEDRTQEIEAYFTNYESYLVRKILTQIIFAIILFLVTGFALVFTYRGYVKQVKLNLLRSDFINNITHELKIPVATAKAALEALQSFGLKADSKTTEEYMNMVSMEMNRLDSLTTKVLEYAKLEGQKQSISSQSVDLTKLSEHIVKSMEVLLKSSDTTISFMSPKEPVMAPIDKVYVEGVIKNLMDNSVKYGGEKTTIQLVLWQDDNHAYISVSDNGPGIPNEYVSRVFDKFFRVPKGNTHNVKGYGLGLSFAHLVMKHHNGSITAENLKTGGCRFILKFPK